MKKKLIVIAVIFHVTALAQQSKSYEEPRNGASIYHHWDGNKYFKILLEKTAVEDSGLLSVFDEKTGKRIFKKKIRIFTTLQYEELKDSKHLLVRTGGYSEITYKLTLGNAVHLTATRSKRRVH